jgi:hypothetical protein
MKIHAASRDGEVFCFKPLLSHLSVKDVMNFVAPFFFSLPIEVFHDQMKLHPDSKLSSYRNITNESTLFVRPTADNALHLDSLLMGSPSLISVRVCFGEQHITVNMFDNMPISLLHQHANFRSVLAYPKNAGFHGVLCFGGWACSTTLRLSEAFIENNSTVELITVLGAYSQLEKRSSLIPELPCNAQPKRDTLCLNESTFPALSIKLKFDNITPLSATDFNVSSGSLTPPRALVMCERGAFLFTILTCRSSSSCFHDLVRSVLCIPDHFATVLQTYDHQPLDSNGTLQRYFGPTTSNVPVFRLTPAAAALIAPTSSGAVEVARRRLPPPQSFHKSANRSSSDAAPEADAVGAAVVSERTKNFTLSNCCSAAAAACADCADDPFADPSSVAAPANTSASHPPLSSAVQSSTAAAAAAAAAATIRSESEQFVQIIDDDDAVSQPDQISTSSADRKRALGGSTCALCQTVVTTSSEDKPKTKTKCTCLITICDSKTCQYLHRRSCLTAKSTCHECLVSFKHECTCPLSDSTNSGRSSPCVATVCSRFTCRREHFKKHHDAFRMFQVGDRVKTTRHEHRAYPLNLEGTVIEISSSRTIRIRLCQSVPKTVVRLLDQVISSSKAQE